VVEALVDGLAEDHWAVLPDSGRDAVRGGMDARWGRAHARLGVASPRELGAIAAGLVRGAEVVGSLTREAEGIIADIHYLRLTARSGLQHAARGSAAARGCLRATVAPPVGSPPVTEPEAAMPDKSARPIELPVEGFPVSAAEVRVWFIDRYGREPGAAELTEIINAMAERETSPPLEGGPGETRAAWDQRPVT
jgi:hypothetical protein